jgi:hypothetical protein
MATPDVPPACEAATAWWQTDPPTWFNDLFAAAGGDVSLLLLAAAEFGFVSLRRLAAGFAATHDRERARAPEEVPPAASACIRRYWFADAPPGAALVPTAVPALLVEDLDCRALYCDTAEDGPVVVTSVLLREYVASYDLAWVTWTGAVCRLMQWAVHPDDNVELRAWPHTVFLHAHVPESVGTVWARRLWAGRPLLGPAPLTCPRARLAALAFHACELKRVSRIMRHDVLRFDIVPCKYPWPRNAVGGGGQVPAPPLALEHRPAAPRRRRRRAGGLGKRRPASQPGERRCLSA